MKGLTLLRDVSVMPPRSYNTLRMGFGPLGINSCKSRRNFKTEMKNSRVIVAGNSKRREVQRVVRTPKD